MSAKLFMACRMIYILKTCMLSCVMKRARSNVLSRFTFNDCNEQLLEEEDEKIRKKKCIELEIKQKKKEAGAGGGGMAA